MSSLALPTPISLAKFWVPPPPGSRLQEVSVRPIRVFFVVTRMSVFKASYRPPPSAMPSIKHKTGNGKCITSLNTLLKLATINSISSDDLSSRYFKSAPEQKWPGSLLCSMAALMLLSFTSVFMLLSSFVSQMSYLVEQTDGQRIFLFWLVKFNCNDILVGSSKSPGSYEFTR